MYMSYVLDYLMLQDENGKWTSLVCAFLYTLQLYLSIFRIVKKYIFQILSWNFL